MHLRTLVCSLYVCFSISSVVIAAPLPEPGKDKSVSLEALLSYAEEHAPALLAAKSMLSLNAALFEGAKPKYPSNPQLGAAIGPRLGGDGASFDLQLSITQSLELNNERGYRKTLAERAQEVAYAELEEARWRVHSLVHQAFHQALIAREHKLAAARLVSFSEELLDITNKRLKAGDVSKLAVKLSEVDVAQAKQTKLQADADYRIACIKMAELSGWPISSVPEPEGGLDLPLRAPALEQLVALALSNHPGLKTQAFMISAADAQLQLAEAEAKPKPYLGLTYVQEAGVFGESVAMLQFGSSLTRFQSNQAARAQAKAERLVAEVALQTTRQSLEGKLARSAEAVNSAAARIELYGAEIIPTFEKNLAMLKKAFELGEIDVLQISLARERFLEAERQALDAYIDYYRSVAELEEEVGAEIWPEETHTTQP